MEHRSGKDRRKVHTMLDPSVERRSGQDRRILDQFKKIKIEENDLIIFRIPKSRLNDHIKRTMSELSKFVHGLGARIVFADKELEIEKFREKQMNKLGWYRKDDNSV